LIDSISIILSSLACLFVVYQAVRLDRITPRFGQAPPNPERPAQAMWTPSWSAPDPERPVAVQAASQPWTPPWD
jgi:hypothetical protein